MIVEVKRPVQRPALKCLRWVKSCVCIDRLEVQIAPNSGHRKSRGNSQVLAAFARKVGRRHILVFQINYKVVAHLGAGQGTASNGVTRSVGLS